MGTVGTYPGTIDGPDRAALERAYAIARETVPRAKKGTSYARAALIYRGKGLISLVQGKKLLAICPYSGSVMASHLDELAHFQTTNGNIHYSAAHQLPDATLRHISQARRAQIDAKAG